MATKGRCPGCGMEGPLGRKFDAHLTKCPDYATAYAQGGVLEPEDEYTRYHASGEVERAKEERLAGFREALQRRRDVAGSRWEGGDTFRHLNVSSHVVPTPAGGQIGGSIVRDSAVGQAANTALSDYLSTLP